MYKKLTQKLDHFTDEEDNTKKRCKDNRGPRHSALNVQLANALTASPIGATMFNQIMCELGIDPGSVDGLQRLINRVEPINRHAAKISMANAISELKEARETGDEIIVAVDAQYNNRLRNRHVPSEPASQAVHTTVALNTRKIVAQQTVSKLCNNCSKVQTDTFLQGDIDYTNLPTCSQKNCPRTLLPQATISDEGALLEKSLAGLEEEGLKVDVVVSDGDAKVAKAVKARGLELNSDIRHKSNNIVKKMCRKQKVNYNDFAGKTLDEKKKEWALFVTSVMKRCNAENKQATCKCKGKGKKKNALKAKALLNCVKRNLKGTGEAVLACHQGICDKRCYYSSNVCAGYGSSKSKYKKQKAKTYIKLGPTPKLSESNKTIIREMINERLEENLHVTYRNAETNIVES